MRMFLVAASLCALALPAMAAPLAPVSPTALQTVLRQGTSATFVFEAHPTQPDDAAGPLPYSQIGTVDFACANGHGDGLTGIIGWEASAATNTSFGPGLGRLRVTTAVAGHKVEVTVTNADGGAYCLVRVTSPGAEVP